MSAVTSESESALASGPITATLFSLALPTMLASLFQSLQGTVNAVWIGRLLGEIALDASYNVNLLVFLLSSAIFGFGVAATMLVGQHLGRGDASKARRVMAGAMGSFAGLGTLAAFVLSWESPALLDLLGTPAAVQPLAIAYLHSRLIATPVAFLILLMGLALRGSGHAVLPLLIAAWLVIGDAALNPLLIRGFGPVPALGIAGSGIATAVSTYIGFAATLVLIYFADTPLRPRPGELRNLLPDVSLLRFLLVKGAPICLQSLVAASASLAMAGLVNSEGMEALAAFTVAAQVWTYIQMPATAVGTAVSAMAAQSIGAGHWHRLGVLFKKGTVVTVLATGGLVAISIFCGPAEVGLFLADSKSGGGSAVHVLQITSWGFVLSGAAAIPMALMRANGAVFAPLLINLAAIYPVRLGVASGMRSALGVDAIWWSFPISSAAMLLLSCAYYKSGVWRRARLAYVDSQALRVVPAPSLSSGPLENSEGRDVQMAR